MTLHRGRRPGRLRQIRTACAPATAMSSRRTGSSSPPVATPGVCRSRAASSRSRIPTSGRCASLPRSMAIVGRGGDRGAARVRLRGLWHRGHAPGARPPRRAGRGRGHLRGPRRGVHAPTGSTSSPASAGSTASRATDGTAAAGLPDTAMDPVVLDVESVMLAVGWPGNLDDLRLGVGGRRDGPRLYHGRRPVADVCAAHLGRRRHHGPDDARPERDATRAASPPRTPSGTAARELHHTIVAHGGFTDPEYGSVGLTEAAASAGGREIVIGKVSYGDLDRAVIDRRTDGFAKIVVDRGHASGARRPRHRRAGGRGRPDRRDGHGRRYAGRAAGGDRVRVSDLHVDHRPGRAPGRACAATRRRGRAWEAMGRPRQSEWERRDRRFAAHRCVLRQTGRMPVCSEARPPRGRLPRGLVLAMGALLVVACAPGGGSPVPTAAATLDLAAGHLDRLRGRADPKHRHQRVPSRGRAGRAPDPRVRRPGRLAPARRRAGGRRRRLVHRAAQGRARSLRSGDRGHPRDPARVRVRAARRHHRPGRRRVDHGRRPQRDRPRRWRDRRGPHVRPAGRSTGCEPQHRRLRPLGHAVVHRPGRRLRAARPGNRRDGRLRRPRGPRPVRHHGDARRRRSGTRRSPAATSPGSTRRRVPPRSSNRRRPARAPGGSGRTRAAGSGSASGTPARSASTTRRPATGRSGRSPGTGRRPTPSTSTSATSSG